MFFLWIACCQGMCELFRIWVSWCTIGVDWSNVVQLVVNTKVVANVNIYINFASWYDRGKQLQWSLDEIDCLGISDIKASIAESHGNHYRGDIATMRSAEWCQYERKWKGMKSVSLAIDFAKSWVSFVRVSSPDRAHACVNVFVFHKICSYVCRVEKCYAWGNALARACANALHKAELGQAAPVAVHRPTLLHSRFWPRWLSLSLGRFGPY